MKTRPDLNRREFLKISAAAGAGLVIGIYLQGCRPGVTPPTGPTEAGGPTAQPSAPPVEAATAAPPAETELRPNIYLRIAKDGTLTVTAFRSEMGQGIRTAIAMILGEELDVDWSTVRIEQAPADPAYGDQVTGGSVSISRNYGTLRAAGAAARQLLVNAAAQTWGVAAGTCQTENGFVTHPQSGRLAYGELVETAASLPLPERGEFTPQEPQVYNLVGAPYGNFDNPEIVRGRAVYGMDVRLPGMLYASVAMCPVFGGKPASFDASQAQAVPGVRQVVEITNGLAVVAENTWAAFQGKRALKITWDEGKGAQTSSAALLQAMNEKAQAQVASLDAGVFSAVYTQPFEAHAPMEPMNCTADVRSDRCEVWAPSQDPQQAWQVARNISGLKSEQVTVHVPLIGGGFGRRHQPDFVRQALELSKAVGAPVQVVWTREDDIQHDFYHPIGVHVISTPRAAPRLPSPRSQQTTGSVPTGYWRSVENFHQALARECFLDELAIELGNDPLALRLELLPESHHAALQLAAAKAGWGEPLPQGWGRGLACYSTFNVTPVAQVAEVSVDAAGGLRVQRVVCAVDCGRVINPDGVKAQMESGIVFGLTAALKAGITIEAGRVKESNFHDHPLLRMDEMPIVEVYLVDSQRDPSGIGEMGVPPTAPALLNAIFNAAGKRIRHIPVRPEDLQAG
ncbi:MAG: molybdopterin cofactor-binding domain-containing protein [Chloroflexota bacterium]